MEGSADVRKALIMLLSFVIRIRRNDTAGLLLAEGNGCVVFVRCAPESCVHWTHTEDGMT